MNSVMEHLVSCANSSRTERRQLCFVCFVRYLVLVSVYNGIKGEKVGCIKKHLKEGSGHFRECRKREISILFFLLPCAVDGAELWRYSIFFCTFI